MELNIGFLYDWEADLLYSDMHDSHLERETEPLGDMFRLPIATTLCWWCKAYEC